MEKKIQVIIADDNTAIQNHFKTILEGAENIEVCALASSGKEAVVLADKLKPDIILMDIQMLSLIHI